MTGASERRIVVTTTSDGRSPELDAVMQELREQTLRDLENAKTAEERERLRKVLAATPNVAEPRQAPDLYEKVIQLANAQKIEEALAVIEQILSSTAPGTMYHLAALDLKRQIESQR